MSTIVAILSGTARSLDLGNRSITTGIDKRPVERATVTANGLVDDLIGDAEHHGGPDQALYLYTREDLDWWSERRGLSFTPRPGLFGENVLLEGLDSATLRIGDRLALGSVQVELTAPRIPCSTLAAHVGEPGFVKRFVAARRPGVYARVLQPGELTPGMTVVHHAAADQPLVNEVFDLWYAKRPDEAVVRRMLEAPLAVRARAVLEGMLPS